MKDIKLLEKIKLALDSEHKIGVYTNYNGYGIGNKYCALRVKDEQIEHDLALLGVVPRKTKQLSFPGQHQVPSHLIRHFIRGFFDGDGSVYKTQTPCISFTGTYEMLSGIKEEMQKITNTQANIHPYKNKDVFEYKVGGEIHMTKIYEYLYKDATIFLGRKKDKFEEVLR